MPAFDMFSEANVYSARLREIYEAHIRAGFSEQQAFELVKAFASQSVTVQAAQP
jgi:hypothetical protein